MKLSKPYITAAFLSLLLLGCSYEKNTWTSKSYHNLTAHYNGYFYADEEIGKIESTIQAAHVDDYNKILKLFPSFDSALAKGYLKEAEEAIKMASISIQRHPNSKWVDDAYILVGKARLYTLDWGNAIQTFKYVNTKSEDPDAKHRAIINLIRTFTMHQEYNNAQAAIDFLLKEKLSKENKKQFLLEKAFFHQTQEDYDNMVRSLAEVSPLLKKKDRRGRVYFILGQVYQELGFESEAFNYYRKCLATNPEYETDFYARLYMAQVAEISRSRDINTARKSFRRLLKDSKNKEFKDKIYYEMGAFELKQKNLDQAIENFNLSIREGTNTRIDGEAYLRLGEIYYDTLRNYELSQAYYDSAIRVLPTDMENYEAIKARQEVLNEFVKNLKTIEWQDSLLSMVTLDSATLKSRIDSVLAEKKKAETLAKGKKKKRANRVELTPTNTNIFNTGEDTGETADWYFGNPSAVSLGQAEFQRVWGSIPLQDNWRRSLRLAAPTTDAGTPDVAVGDNADGGEPTAVAEVADPAVAEFNRINSQIPRTDEQKAEALKKIEDAYFKLGDIYYFHLNEKDNAQASYEKLIQRFPESEYVPEALYKLYLITKETDPAKAERYADILKEKYPYTTFARILINPDYLKESSQTAEQQKRMYKEAYEKYQAGEYEAALALVNEALQLGQTVFSAHLELLKVLINGKTSSVTEYRTSLEEFIRTNPDSELVPYAQDLLNASQRFETTQTRSKEINFSTSLEGTHYFVFVYKKNDQTNDAASAVLEAFNKSSFGELQLKTSSLVLNEEYALTMVGDLPDKETAQQYYQSFNSKLPTLAELRNLKFDKFVITYDNFNIFYRTKGVNEYIQFFQKNYRTENP